MSPESLPASYFERLYEGADDPWSFETSAYEHAKYDDSVDALEPHYGRGFEIGCSIGVLTQRLAARCDALLAVDVNARALERARARCADLQHVRFAQLAVPNQFPSECFDLIVVSEVGYYWSDPDLALARDRIAEALVSGGDLLLVHFLPKVEDYVRPGDAVHEDFLADARFARVRGHRAARYRLDLLRRR